MVADSTQQSAELDSAIIFRKENIMSDASELIERMERETGQRIEDNDGNNFAITGLFGALARAMGKSNHDSRDDIEAGVIIKHQMTPEYEREEKGKRMLASMIASGVSPDDISKLMGK